MQPLSGFGFMSSSLSSGPIATDRHVIDHAASEPESATSADTSYERELARLARSRAAARHEDSIDGDPVNAAIRRAPARAMLIAAGVGFAVAVFMR